MSGPGIRVRVSGELARNADAVERLVAERVASRLFDKDATLWGPEAEPEASVRLGWVDPFSRASALIEEASELRDALRQRGMNRVVLCGMGGSSLGPEVIARWAGVPLELLDSTHPAAVRRALSGDLASTVVVVSSKSGTTIETRSHLAAFETAFASAGLSADAHIVTVTDPGSELEARARAAGYRCFLADPNVGGRFSALTAFGLVPGVLAGADMSGLVAEAASVRSELGADSASNPALQLAAALASGLPAKYVIALSEADDARWGLGEWIEQLVAESTGKLGRGLLPIALPSHAPEVTGSLSARCVGVRLAGSRHDEASEPQDLSVSGGLGAQLLLWETATAVLGHLMHIDPFNQPDVEAAKIAARAALADAALMRTGDEVLTAPAALVEQLRQAVPSGGYLVIQAYLDPAGGCAPLLSRLRGLLAQSLGVPVALGWGPRYLHSTGQLHKGGPQLGAFLQVLDSATPELEIPGSEAGFGALIHAQARGDRQVLRGQGRTVLTISTDSPAAYLAEMAEAL